MSKFLVGQKGSFSKTITEYDVYSFAGITGDFNCVHINKIEAERSIFGKQVVHGCLTSSFISTVLGMVMPGEGTILLGMDVKYIKPVYIGDTINAEAEILELDNSQAILNVSVSVIDGARSERVVIGKAIVKLPK